MWKGGGVVQPPPTDAKEAVDAELTSFHFVIADHDGRLRADIDWDVNLGWSMMEEKVQHSIEMTKLLDSIDSSRKAVHSRLAEFEESLVTRKTLCNISLYLALGLFGRLLHSPSLNRPPA